MVIRFVSESGVIRSAGGVDRKMKVGLAPVNEVGRDRRVSEAGSSDHRVLSLQAELDAALKEIERLRRDLSMARAEVKRLSEVGSGSDPFAQVDLKPWVKEGISKATYYRKLKHQGQGGE